MITSEAFMDQVLQFAFDDELEADDASNWRPQVPDDRTIQGGDIGSGKLKAFRKLHGLS
jgi:hypothetical protein